MENQSTKAKGAEPTPEPAVPAALSAFDKYEVVGMQVAHGLKDVDDFILSLGGEAPSRRMATGTELAAILRDARFAGSSEDEV